MLPAGMGVWGKGAAIETPCLLADAVLPADLGCCQPSLSLFQNRDDLLLGVSRPFHGRSPLFDLGELPFYVALLSGRRSTRLRSRWQF